MKLLTHNMLQCHIKGVQNGYPLKVEADKVWLGGGAVALLPGRTQPSAGFVAPAAWPAVRAQ